MCRLFIEVQYLTRDEDPIQCNHFATWELPSPDPSCNGIRHIMVHNRLKPCIHCWVSTGSKKRTWRRAGFAPKETDGLDPETRHILELQTLSYPIQPTTAIRESACPTWERAYKFRSRDWANRFLTQKRMNIWELYRDPSAYADAEEIHNIDADVQESVLFQVVEPAAVRNNQTTCMVCFEEFVPEVTPGGLRQLPCEGGHTFCLACIRTHFLTVAERRRDGEPHRVPYACPLCRQAWGVKILEKRDMRGRIRFLFRRYRIVMERHFAQGEPGPIEVGGFPKGWLSPVADYIYGSMLFVLLWPMFVTVDHTMQIWNCRNGNLPRDQMLVVSLTGTVLQASLLAAMMLLCWVSKWILLNPKTWSAILLALFINEVRKNHTKHESARTVRAWISNLWARFRVVAAACTL